MLICASDLGGAMKYIRCLAIICAVALTGTTSTLADCGAGPKPPELPNGAIAGPEEMKKALDSTAAFDVAVKNYADCLVAAAQEEAAFIAAMQEAAEEYNRLIAVAQAAMDERNALVERWNVEAETFRARLAD